MHVPPYYSLEVLIEIPIYPTMSRPYLCSDPSLNNHSSSEGGCISIFGFAVFFLILSTSSAIDVKA
jgi:hypothetical protein